MGLLGTYFTLLMGPTVPLPLPPDMLDALESVEVTHRDDGLSGFKLEFRAGRSGAMDLMDFPLLSNPQMRVLNRVMMIVTLSGIPRVLFDGVIVNLQLEPGDAGKPSKLNVVGEDVSVMMDMEEVSKSFPAQPPTVITLGIIAQYAQYGLVPMVIPSPADIPPNPIERVPQQRETDLQYLYKLAKASNYVFYIKPGPVPGMNTAYFGPSARIGIPQAALTANMGSMSNVSSIKFQNDALQAVSVHGDVQDKSTNQSVPVQNPPSVTVPLAAQPPQVGQSAMRRKLLKNTAGMTASEAFAAAQAQAGSTQDSVSAEGELDTLEYGNILEARGLVGLRGVGFTYNGLYYVQSVTHFIHRGSYKQKFKLKRDGTGSTVPAVIPS